MLQRRPPVISALEAHSSTAMIKALAGFCAKFRASAGGVDERDFLGTEPKTALSILLRRFVKPEATPMQDILDQLDAVCALLPVAS